MPNFRALMTMPADGDDLARVIGADCFRRRCEAAYPPDWGCWGGPPEHIAAFNKGDHAPAASVLERAARFASSLTSPAGADAVGVANDIAGADMLADWIWSRLRCLSPVLPRPAPVKRGGWVMHNGGPRIADAKWIKQRTWPPVANRTREATDDDWLWTNPNSCLCVIAYSTDKQCPEWVEPETAE